ncbi:MAG: Holliday junction branch migration protein RuvA [Rikenellaceae bacterium]|nr:Holliday junction branch migration protein RuvA [Rikenellaceae bacterium]
MYEYIRGKVAELAPAFAVIEAGGIGYYLNISLQTFAALNGQNESTLYTHLVVRDDAHILFGFLSRQERELFRLLIGVSGVGPNTARMILSTYSPGEVCSIIGTGRAETLKSVKGLGIKTAQKIIVELKDKIAGIAAAADTQLPAEEAGSELFDEAAAALTMLGFSRQSSEKVLRQVIGEHPGESVENIIRLSLKRL